MGELRHDRYSLTARITTAQTLERFRDSLALVVGMMGQRFGSPTGKAESGTEEEFNWALESHYQTGFPEIKWFFRRIEKFVAPPDLTEIEHDVEQWKRVGPFVSACRVSTLLSFTRNIRMQ